MPFIGCKITFKKNGNNVSMELNDLFNNFHNDINVIIELCKSNYIDFEINYFQLDNELNKI
jgi:hypothetical protein